VIEGDQIVNLGVSGDAKKYLASKRSRQS